MPPAFRRRFVLGCSLTGAFALAFARPPASAVPARSRVGGEAYAFASWQSLVGAVLPTGRGTVRLERLRQPDGEDGQAFELHFRVVGGPAPGNALIVTHPEHGRIPFMITPYGLTCVAVVNHRRG